MTLKPPRILAPRTAPAAVDVLEYEVLQEKAASLGRVTQAFEAALAALAAFDLREADDAQDAAERERLLDRAGEALWFFVVQRELCGLRNTEAVLRDYHVPAAVRLRMGVARPARGGSR